MAGWRDKLLDASFRGVPFKVRSHEAPLGRRNEVHQYPGRDDPFVEDLGQEAGVWSFEAFIIGPDYFADRDKLVDALNKKGPGELVHPYLGRKTAAVTDAALSESFDEGGLARFRLEFTQTTEPLYPAAQTDTWTIIRGKTVAAQEASIGSFTERMGGWIKLASNYAQQAMGLLGGNMIQNVLGLARRYLPVGTLLGAVNSLSRAGLGLVSLIRDPGGFARGYMGLLGNWTSIAQGLSGSGSAPDRELARAGYAALASGVTPSAGLPAVIAATYSSPDDPRPAVRSSIAAGVAVSVPAVAVRIPAGAAITSEDAILIAMAAEIDALGRRLALCEEALATAQMEWDSYADAIAARDSLAARLQAEAEIAEDGVSLAFQDLRMAVVEDITTRAADLRRLATYTPRATLPACVIGYSIYGDAAWGDDIAARNRIVNPLFVRGGESLEVLGA